MLAAQVTIFHIWKQRNNCLHNGTTIPPSTIVKLIDREVRNVITARRRKKAICGLNASMALFIISYF
ncbi:unnamed protein product [Eruca vesicaria subsp. sativa]|uniref:Uncharacterized protein n=1 Tax=Eruca vesicaria subsp. sativa TaxID=29727 RepID=A0ABC8K7L9_ERUVS|nr:unnamed protein product [Eruca vesicaria subsp. sativa]